VRATAPAWEWAPESESAPEWESAPALASELVLEPASDLTGVSAPESESEK